MPADQRRITRADIIDLTTYGKERAGRRKAIIPIKKLRRVEVGPHATFYFECYETMWQQVHEMLYIERGGEPQIDDELSAYNPLIPQKGEIVATLMFEIEDESQRGRVLRQLTNIEETAYLDIGGEKVKAGFESDVDRTAADGKTSSVHFLRFRLSSDQIARFNTLSVPVMLGFTHSNYGHLAIVPTATRQELAKDLG
ncbi:MAG: DUF3501 family protein [Alphaproteobacteria bacterium]|nr:DUF3501 family protein [Alphaproteobacteria bacterium]